MASKRDTKSQDLFKKTVPEMPNGYYSGDKPNPHLRAFVEQHIDERPYDATTDQYDAPVFDKPIETTKATAIYMMHTYWSKKPHDAIRQYIRHYTSDGDLVLDPFCGSGGTALAALLEGRKAIAIDRSPAATFITKNYCTPVDPSDLQHAFDKLKSTVKPELDWLYETKCDRCGGAATTAYTVYSQVFQCPRCMERVTLFDCGTMDGETAGGKPKTVTVCPHCAKRGLTEEISPRDEKLGAVPVLVSYLCENGCRPARDERRHNDAGKKKREYFAKYDLTKLNDVESKPIPYWHPTLRMMNAPEDQVRWALLWRPYLGDRATVADFFRHRNLWALAAIRDGIIKLDVLPHLKDALLFALSSMLLNASDMYRYRESGKGGLSMGTLYIGPLFQVMNAWRGFEDKISDMLRGYAQLNADVSAVSISTQSATSLGSIPSGSVDYIFTDPPYSWKVQYGESNFIWEAWLGFDTKWHDEEIIVNDVRRRTETDWAQMMRLAMAECYRVLKPGRTLSLCYHDTSEGTWALVQDIMAETGFLVGRSDEALYIDTGQKAWKQIVADKVNKRDLVINFRKPKPGETTFGISFSGSEDASTFTEKVRLVISSYLSAYPGATKDRVFDEVVSRMVRAGQMEAHNFDEILRSVAEEVKTPVKKDLFRNEDPNLFGMHEVSRWYLKESELDVGDGAESAKEDTAADKLETFMKAHLKKHPEVDGVHYSDLFEQYVYSVKEKPRRQLADFLPDYFFQTEAGTWRPPASTEEAKAKAEGRAKGTGRRVKRYIALLEQGVAIPDRARPNDASLAEWIRHCKRAGLYDQGKLLYEKGGLNLDKLPEEIMVGVEEDYQVCVRMLAREEGAKPAKKRKGAKV